MAIYLHPLDEKPNDINEDNWVEIDLVSWGSYDEEYPIQLTLVRRLNTSHQEPYLQELMFAGLYNNKPIKELTLEIPHSTNSLDYKVYTLSGVKVLNYSIYPSHPQNKKNYEKVIIAAKSKTPTD
jgi:hypothetical protein